MHFFGSFFAYSSTKNDSTADLVILNGQILTLDQKFSKAEAVAIRDGLFIEMGSNEAIKEYITEETRVINVKGRTVIPGLIESHVHATGASQSEAGQPFIQLGSIEEVQQWLCKKAISTPADEWIRLPRIEITRIKEGRFPTQAELDEAAPQHPAVFIWQYAVHQIQVLNSAAMKVANITQDTSVPKNGKVHFDENGEPTGVLKNCNVLTERFLSHEEISHQEYKRKLAELLRKYTEVSKFADLAILSNNPLTCREEKIKEITSV